MTLAQPADLDDELIARIRAGDEHAFEQLFRRYHRRLRIYAARIERTEGAAEEVVQETFFRIWMHRERLQPVSSLAGLLYAIARRVALNRVDKARTESRWRVTTDIDALDVPFEAADADSAMRETEMALAIERAIAQLPPRCREAFLLRRQGHLSYAEIAQQMQTTAKTVENQITKALRMLRSSLAEWL